MTFEEIKKQAILEWESLTKGDKTQILIGTPTCGQGAGALSVLEAIKAELAQNKIDADITEVGCMGLCYAEPLVDIIKPNQPRVSYGNVTPEIASQLIKDYVVNDNPHPELALGTIGEGSVDGIPNISELPMLKPQTRIALRNCGIIDPVNINHYVANDGFNGLVKAFSMKPEEVIEEMKKSGLRGRGGAGFPTGMKWEFCRKAAGEKKYVICNADEGDPGSFVDRTLLEGDPFSVLEGLIISAYAIGANEGFIYIRSEYPQATKKFKTVIQQATEKGLLGENILGSGFDFKLEIRQGAGAFICGEETALINSIEGRAGNPRIRPPYPAEVGLWGQPTSVNNVETLADVPSIMEKGADWYAGMGVGRSLGTKLFSITGSINRSGVIEIPFGMTLRNIVEDICGGVPDGRKLKAIQPAGGMLGIISAKDIDHTVSYETLPEIGSGLSSGGLIIIDDTACMVDIAYSLINFAYNEMCGKCSIGRLGTKQTMVILEKAITGKGQVQDIDMLAELAELMPAGTFCPLCAGSPCPTRSLLTNFRDELEAHIKEHRCPAGVCQGMNDASQS